MSNLDTPPGRMITSGAAAEILSCDPKTVRKYVARGLLRAYRLPTGQHRYREEDVLRLLRPVGGDAA
jgi:predicted site-specific integrase-resolvase